MAEDQYQDEIDELTLECEDLREQLAAKDSQLEELNDKLDQLKADQADKDRDADAAFTLKRQFEADLSARDQEIVKLKTDLRTVQNENDNLKDKLQAAKAEAKKALVLTAGSPARLSSLSLFLAAHDFALNLFTF